jgi:hypothetical protein
MSDSFQSKPIAGFPGYRVTSDGRIQSAHRRGTKAYGEWRDLRPGPNAKGYLGLTICSDGRRWSTRVHRLVAEAFVPNPKALPCVRHLDGNNTNNAASNLAWGTYADNERDKLGHGTWDARRGGGKLSEQQRAEARSMRDHGWTHSKIAAALGVSRPAVSRLLSGKTWVPACA